MIENKKIEPRYVVRDLAEYGYSSYYSIYDRKENKYMGKFLDIVMCINVRRCMENFYNKDKKQIEVIL